MTKTKVPNNQITETKNTSLLKDILLNVRPSNGDILLYHTESNTFGAYTKNGTPKTFFKPDDAFNYWLDQ